MKKNSMVLVGVLKQASPPSA